MKCGRKVCHKCHVKPLIPDCDWFKPNLVAHLSNSITKESGFALPMGPYSVWIFTRIEVQFNAVRRLPLNC